MRPKTAAGTCMMLASFGFFGVGGFILKSGLDEQTRIAASRLVTDKQCKELLATLPMATITDGGKTVAIVMRNIVDPRKALTDASVATMMCPARKLTEVCLGDKCPGSQDQVVLTFKLTEEKS